MVQGSGFRVVVAASPQIVMGRSAPVLLAFPRRRWKAASAVDRVLSYIVDLRRSPSLFFTPPSQSNLRPFGAPPSIGRRDCPREPLPLEGAAERSEAGLASFFGGARVLSYNRALETISPLFFIPLEPYPARSARHLPHAGKALCALVNKNWTRN